MLLFVLTFTARPLCPVRKHTHPPIVAIAIDLQWLKTALKDKIYHSYDASNEPLPLTDLH